MPPGQTDVAVKARAEGSFWLHPESFGKEVLSSSLSWDGALVNFQGYADRRSPPNLCRVLMRLTSWSSVSCCGQRLMIKQILILGILMVCSHEGIIILYLIVNPYLTRLPELRVAVYII